MTNGGKSTLSQSLHQQIPNSCIIAQDSYFKVNSVFSRTSCLGCLAPLKLKALFIPQDASAVPEDSCGFKQYDSKVSINRILAWYSCSYILLSWRRQSQSCSLWVLDALHMDTMMSDVDSWRRDPVRFLRQRSLNPSDEQLFVLIVEGFLIFNYRLVLISAVLITCF